MKQYAQIKAKHPGALLLFRVGDFYETFGEDAIVASKVLGIVLTRRANGKASHIELAGFPHHSLDTYLPKLVRAGHRVAICDQLEDPKATKKIVKRGVTELVTPGVTLNDKVLESKQSNYLAAIYKEKNETGVAFLDISTGEFLVAQGSKDYIDKLLSGLKPSEIIHSKKWPAKERELLAESYYTYTLDDWIFGIEFGYERLLRHFGVQNLKGFGIEDQEKAVIAAGACLYYLEQTHHHMVDHISTISRIEEERYVWMDPFTVRNLEIIYSLHPQGKCLLDVLDRTESPMGGRLLRKWLVLPLKEKEAIMKRQRIVEQLFVDRDLREQLIEPLQQIGDIERLVSKLAVQRINPREIRQMVKALECVSVCYELLINSNGEISKYGEQLNPCTGLREKIEKTIVDNPPLAVNKGSVIRKDVDEELDSLREVAFSGKDYLARIQQQESQRTGIPSLKIAFNNVFGYYIEVTNTHKDKVPPEWVRKQTLVNAERYITEELKEYEAKILTAEEKIGEIETRIFNELVQYAQDYISHFQINGRIIGQLDCLLSFARVSEQNDYHKPEIDDSYVLALKDCRHPVIEKQLPSGESYIPNDLVLNNTDQEVIILTGPNMSGKSALLRQTALAVLLAQIGCYVPAKHAHIGIVDKIYTRVGASDNISQGESTFMVEMTETASILNNLSARSLILLDEIGRGTSTFDGISLAWSIAEYIHLHPTKAKTLFATHYHELNELENQYDGIVNYHVTTKEVGKKVIFLRKIRKGGSEHSFGIHVAQMAGIPAQVVKRAEKVLEQLEGDKANLTGKESVRKLSSNDIQLQLFQINDPKIRLLIEELNKIDTNAITPIEALMKLNEIKTYLDE